MITKEQFESYEGVRKSGITNMFNIRLVSKISCLDSDIIFKIMREYSDLKKTYTK